jgi:hypothetical protein
LVILQRQAHWQWACRLDPQAHASFSLYHIDGGPISISLVPDQCIVSRQNGCKKPLRLFLYVAWRVKCGRCCLMCKMWYMLLDL